MSTVKEESQKQYEASKLKLAELITVKFDSNYNNKLYGKYFTTIRKHDSKIIKGNIYDIALNGKGIKLARCISANVIPYHELSDLSIMLDTGMEYGEANQLFYDLGLNTSSFETMIKYCVFRTE